MVHAVARELGIADALGHTRAGKLALWQIIARVIDQGSRLSAVRLATSHAAGPGDVTFVGDHGMLKGRQIEDVREHGFHYITHPITRRHIRPHKKRPGENPGSFSHSQVFDPAAYVETPRVGADRRRSGV